MKQGSTSMWSLTFQGFLTRFFKELTRFPRWKWMRKLWSNILSLSIKRAPSSLLVYQRGIKSPQSSNPWEITLMVLFTLSQNWSFLRVIPCSRAPFSNLLDTMCRNVVLGYSKSGRGEACDWVTDQCFQAINVLKDNSLIESDHNFVTLTPSIQSWTK